MKWVDQPFPSSGLIYPKTEEKLPFMTWDEIARRLKAGGNADGLWECLYHDTGQITELLAYVKAKHAPSWVYPMMVMAAHTGARRSEMIRAKLEDTDLSAGVITIREKKRARGTLTTRRVPVSRILSGVLKPLLKRQSGKSYLFGQGDLPYRFRRRTRRSGARLKTANGRSSKVGIRSGIASSALVRPRALTNAFWTNGLAIRQMSKG